MADPLPVVLREAARQDVQAAVDWYRDAADVDTALRFVDAFQDGIRHLGAQPASGSPRLAVELGLPGLRSWLLDGFPYLVFHVEGPDHLDVWRVLHAHRDIPVWLRDRESETGSA